MVAATGDGRWMITATTTMRGRRGEEEVHMTIEDEGVGKDNDTTDDDDRRNNTTIKRFTGEGGMVMVRSKEGCAVGRGGARRRFLFSLE